jgi:flagellar biosynthesis protein FlhG
VDQASALRKIISDKASDIIIGDASVNSPRVIAITSGKGGVGKTNITGNLAIAFAMLGKKVFILDADLGLANIDIIFGINPKYNLNHVIKGEKELSEILVKGPFGVKIISGGSGFSDIANLTEGQKLNLLSEFEALDNEIDILLIDTGAGISSNVLYFNLAAEECIIITTLEPTAITDAYAMIKVMSTEHNMKYFKLLVNNVSSLKEAKSVYLTLSKVIDKFLNDVVVEYIGFIPLDNKLKKAVLNRKAVLDLFPDTCSSKSFTEIAAALDLSPRRHESDGNLKFFLNRFVDLYSVKK